MGYFDGLANSSFKKDAEGRDLFFPHGMMGKGRVLPDAETADALRAKIVNFYKLLMFGGIPLMVVLVNLPGGIPLVVAIGVLFCIGSWFYLRHLTSDYPISDERITYAEAQRSAARGHSYIGLVVLSVISLLFVAGGVFILLVGDADSRLVGLLCTVFFGACFCVFLWMIVSKRRQAQP